MPQSAASFSETLEALRRDVNAALSNTLERFQVNCPERLSEAMRYSLLAGGKRIRPILVLLACEACGHNAVHAMPAACAIEMVHTYSLIHDDLPAMDDDALRRGRPTCHVQFDEATAVLAGDGLLTLAFEVLATDIRPGDVAAECCRELAAAAGIGGMVGGQMADLQSEHAGAASVEELEAIHNRKTGRLLQAAVGLGARIAGAPSEIRATLQRYGQCFGLAFQIVDDLLDVTGDLVKLGKDVGKDREHGKLTYPSILGEAASRRRAQELIDEARRCLAPFGEHGRCLDALATFVLERDH